MAEIHTLLLETVTPVSIGSGDKLSPYSDFVLAGRNVYYVNENEIKRALESKPALMDEYVNGIVSEMDNNRSNFDLFHFLEKKLNLDVKKTATQKIPAEAKGIQQLSTIIKNAGVHPYIPGSSVKGAIRTALLYNWIMDNDDGKKWLYDFIQALNNKERRKELENISEQIFSQQETELGITDSGLFSVESIKIYETQRLHLKDSARNGILQTLETIDAANTTTFKLTGKLPLDTIFDAVWRFSKDGNDEALSMLEKIGNKVDNATRHKLSGYYKNIDKQLDGGEVLLRLGFGKGYFLNSIGLAVAYYERGKYFGQFLKIYGHTNFKNADHFPVTQVITALGKQPLGWVKLKKQKNV